MILLHQMSANLSALLLSWNSSVAPSNEVWSKLLAARALTEFGTCFALLSSGFLARHVLQSIGAFQQRRHSAISSKDHHRFYEALLQNSEQAVLILDTDGDAPISFGGGAQLLNDCLSSPTPTGVARGLNNLLKLGHSFDETAVTNDGHNIVVRGQPIGRRAVLFFRDEHISTQLSQLQTIMDLLPIPIWIRKRDLRLHWANQAFMQTIEDFDLQSTNSNRNESWDHDLTLSALKANQLMQRQQLVTVAGRQQLLALTVQPLDDEHIVGFAANKTGQRSLETQLTESQETFFETIALLPVSLALFDQQQRLIHYNRSYASLWDLPLTWLDTQPSLGMIYDRLREENKLPQQRNFSSWKDDQLGMTFGPREPETAIWHLPGNKTIQSSVHKHPRGRMQITEDISNRVVLETSLNLLIEVQKAVIETLEDAAAIFGPNGRLLLCNTLFASLWNLNHQDLSLQPHIASITSISAARHGRDGIWEAVSDAIYAIKADSRRRWGRVVRGDGKPLSLSVARLPNSATIVLFSDLTDLEQFEAMQREGSSSPQSIAGQYKTSLSS